MSTVISAVGHAQPTAHAKRLVAASMFAKGKAFLGAAILLRQKGGDEFVVLYLLCQGIEVSLKGILLFIDYDKYKPQLKRIGHKLLSLSEATAKAVGLSPLKKDVYSELEVLSNLYSQHLLRYGSLYDIFVNPCTISSDRVLRRMVAVLRLAKRKSLCA